MTRALRYDVCPQAAEFGDGVYLVQGCKAIVNAWCGGLDTQRQMVVWSWRSQRLRRQRRSSKRPFVFEFLLIGLG